MRRLLKFITCGSVDDGKSTLIGHILYDSKLLYADQKRALELDSKVGSRGGEIDYSLLLDGLTEEREQGITIDVAYRYFTTNARSFIVADTPGHEQYTRNMAVGASFADLAVILLDARKGVLVQTRRHARICALVGIRFFVFAINKMDLVGYSQEVFEKIAGDVRALAEELHIANYVMIPVSATEGDNVTRKSGNLGWFDGPALLPYLEEVEVDGQDGEAGFYLPVQRVCRPDQHFRGFQGQIEAGTLSEGDEVLCLPEGEKARVRNIFRANAQVAVASAGEPVTVTLDREIDVSRGSVITKGVDIPLVNQMTVDLLWMDSKELLEGGNFFLKAGTAQVPCTVTEILYKQDVNTGEHVLAKSLEKNEIARCRIRLAGRIVADLFDRHKTLGELILIDRVSFMTCACGVIKGTEYEGHLDGNAARMRNLLLSQRGVAVEFVETREVTSDLLSHVERKLIASGRCAYLYDATSLGESDGDIKAIKEAIRNLTNAGIVTLVLVSGRQGEKLCADSKDSNYFRYSDSGMVNHKAAIVDNVLKASAIEP